MTLNPSTGVISGTPTQAGTYDVDASVSDGRGGVGTADFIWVVNELPPQIAAVVAPIVAVSQQVSYAASASGASALQYAWDFGDGTPAAGPSTSPNVTHTFTARGAYLVTLTATTAGGASSSYRFLQGVKGPVLASSAKSSSSMALETRAAASQRLWVVNIDNDSVSVFDTATGNKLQEISVGDAPRTVAVAPNGKIWVTNKASGTLSVIDPNTFGVTYVDLPYGSAPYGVLVGSDDSAFVTLEGRGSVFKLNASGAVLDSSDVGPNPRHLALTPSGDRLLVSRFITRPIPGESTAAIQTVVGGVKQGGEVLVLSSSTLDLNSSITLQFSDKPDTTVSGRGLPNYLGAPAIAPDGLSAWVPSKQDNIERGTLRDGLALDFQNTVRAVSSRIELPTLTENYAARIDHDNAGLASAAVHHPSGVYMFVALETSRQVAVVDPARNRELFRADTGIAPQALVVSADGLKLYVNNAMQRTVGVYDLSPLVNRGETVLPLTATLNSVQVEKLAPPVLLGKQFFYDARDTRLARDAYLSCAACHNDGDADGRTWDFTGFGEGLRNTISLRGRGAGHGRLHWSANFDELQDFEGQIRSFAQGTGLMSDAALALGTRLQPLGDAKAGISSDLDALAAYVASLDVFADSPYRTAEGAFTASAEIGAMIFEQHCATCHGGADFSDSASLVLHDIGSLKSTSGTRLGGPLLGIDSPTLRDVWATAPYLHDGSAPSLADAIAAHSSIQLTAGELPQLVDYLLQLDQAAPAPSP
jgi:YVTN family beta-propeller protein